ncbi:unnamed protein product [Arctogadus glacialis]
MSAHIAFTINPKVGSGQSTSGISWFPLLRHNKAVLVKAAPVTSQLAEDHGNLALETHTESRQRHFNGLECPELVGPGDGSSSSCTRPHEVIGLVTGGQGMPRVHGAQGSKQC